jgi:hypothetical protein
MTGVVIYGEKRSSMGTGSPDERSEIRGRLSIRRSGRGFRSSRHRGFMPSGVGEVIYGEKVIYEGGSRT